MKEIKNFQILLLQTRSYNIKIGQKLYSEVFILLGALLYEYLVTTLFMTEKILL